MVVGGVIPQGDYDFLLKNGATIVFGPGTRVTDAAVKLIDILEKKKWSS